MDPQLINQNKHRCQYKSTFMNFLNKNLQIEKYLERMVAPEGE
jgi:hypothetical protein